MGIVDERLTFEQYLEYRTDHLFDNVALARESFVADIMELAEQLRGCGVEVGDKGWRQEDKFYYLWGAKQTDAISREAEEQVTGADQTVDESGRLPQGEPADPKSEASKLVQSLGPVKLSRYAVVGNHVRYDYHLRDWLKDIHSQILAALGRSTEKIQCFMGEISKREDPFHSRDRRGTER